MKLKAGGVWIDYEYKKEYQDSSQKGLRVFYSKKLDKESVDDIKKFINFLRKRYYFPLRCNIYIRKVKDFPSLDGIETTKGVFLFGDEQLKKFPKIYVACEISSHWNVIDVYYSIVKLLTYYFQWYFFEDNRRNDKSLEYEATKYAKYLVSEYLNNNLLNL